MFPDLVERAARVVAGEVDLIGPEMFNADYDRIMKCHGQSFPSIGTPIDPTASGPCGTPYSDAGVAMQALLNQPIMSASEVAYHILQNRRDYGKSHESDDELAAIAVRKLMRSNVVRYSHDYTLALVDMFAFGTITETTAWRYGARVCFANIPDAVHQLAGDALKDRDRPPNISTDWCFKLRDRHLELTVHEFDQLITSGSVAPEQTSGRVELELARNGA